MTCTWCADVRGVFSKRKERGARELRWVRFPYATMSRFKKACIDTPFFKILGAPLKPLLMIYQQLFLTMDNDG